MTHAQATLALEALAPHLRSKGSGPTESWSIARVLCNIDQCFIGGRRGGGALNKAVVINGCNAAGAVVAAELARYGADVYTIDNYNPRRANISGCTNISGRTFSPPLMSNGKPAYEHKDGTPAYDSDPAWCQQFMRGAQVVNLTNSAPEDFVWTTLQLGNVWIFVHEGERYW